MRNTTVPDGWPSDNEEPPSMESHGSDLPAGYFEVHARDDMKRVMLRAGSVLSLLEMPNPKDGCKVVVVGNTFYHVDETYDAVRTLIAEARIKEDRGF